INPGDVVLCPDPGYPVYSTATVFAGGTPVYMPLVEKNNYLPDLGAIDTNILKKAKLIHVNYPNNPTGAVATKKFYQELIEFARKSSILVSRDAASTQM